MENILQDSYLGNTLQQYLTALAIVVIGLIALRIFRTIILNRLRKWAARTETELDDLAVNGIEKFVLPILNLALVYFSITTLTLSDKASKILGAVVAAVLTFFAIRVVTSTLGILLKSYVTKQENGEVKLKQLRGITAVINILVWVLGLVILFDNLGYNVTAIITGLGIGGIAVALAAQNILGDLFNYFVIFFDRPFEIGDFIVVDDKKGTVEYIGLKSTRLKSLTGEQLVLSNSNLTSSRVHNFKRMDERRIVFTLGIVYETPLEKVKEVAPILRSIIEEQPKTRFDRAHFAAFGSYSLNFEVVYFVNSAAYNEYMDIQQAVNFRILEEFEKRGIAFAYPTQTIFSLPAPTA
ncbi:MAG: mechanosensitive ion channel family protein [Cyclobacteriaceae bacterium]|nr:mechanosensitive ion channel family protein [Cyclobacteriaceae bacterium]